MLPLPPTGSCEVPSATPACGAQAGIARLKRYFNEVLFDQLPVLKETQRAVDEIMLSVAPSSADIKQGRLILEQARRPRFP